MKTEKFKHLLPLVIIILLNQTVFSQNKTILINEVLAANKNVSFDGFGEFDDWVELYNPTDTVINLKDIYITNDILNPLKHCLSEDNNYWMTIPPKGYIILWLDNDPEQGSRHLPFKLKKEKGAIALYDKDTNQIDLLLYQNQSEDVTIGRSDLNDSNILLYNEPTPNKKNVDGLILSPDYVFVDANYTSGFYQKPISIQLTSTSTDSIYYTIDGSDPSNKSTKYTGPFIIDSTVVLKSCAIKDGFIFPKILTHTYFIGEKSDLSVLSLSTNPKDLWGKKKGIYKNYNKIGLEKQATAEYFKKLPDSSFNLAFKKSVDIRISGKTSRRQEKRSFAIFSNNIDGQEKIDCKLFDDKNIHTFSSFGIRADATSGINVSELYVGERFKNELLYEVNKEMNGNVDMQCYEPILLFLNGKYWGIYNLMERKGQNFISDNHGEFDVDILTAENAKVVKGDLDDYENMLEFISINDIRTEAVYSEVCNLMDISSYIDYWVYETYCGAHDINVNIRYWKSRKEGGKWRWISYDQDSWKLFDEKALDYYLNRGMVFLLEELMKNHTFRNQWINRMCDYLNTSLKPNNVIKLVDEITTRISNEVDRDRSRWEKEMLYVDKYERINWIKEYAEKRPFYILSEINSIFNLPGKPVSVKVNSENLNGSIKINSVITKNEAWEGTYLENIPITLEAIPNEGYSFVKWKQRKLKKTKLISVDPKHIKNFRPIFEQKKTLVP